MGVTPSVPVLTLGNTKCEAEDGQVESPRNRMDSIRIRLRTTMLGEGPGGKKMAGDADT